MPWAAARTMAVPSRNPKRALIKCGSSNLSFGRRHPKVSRRHWTKLLLLLQQQLLLLLLLLRQRHHQILTMLLLQQHLCHCNSLPVQILTSPKTRMMILILTLRIVLLRKILDIEEGSSITTAISSTPIIIGSIMIRIATISARANKTQKTSSTRAIRPHCRRRCLRQAAAPTTTTTPMTGGFTGP